MRIKEIDLSQEEDYSEWETENNKWWTKRKLEIED